MEAWEGFMWGWTQRTCGPRCAGRGEGQTRALGSAVSLGSGAGERWRAARWAQLRGQGGMFRPGARAPAPGGGRGQGLGVLPTQGWMGSGVGGCEGLREGGSSV